MLPFIAFFTIQISAAFLFFIRVWFFLPIAWTHLNSRFRPILSQLYIGLDPKKLSSRRGGGGRIKKAQTSLRIRIVW